MSGRSSSRGRRRIRTSIPLHREAAQSSVGRGAAWWSSKRARGRQFDGAADERGEQVFVPLLYGCPDPLRLGGRRCGAMVPLTRKPTVQSRFPRLSKVMPVGTSCPSSSPCISGSLWKRAGQPICPSSSQGPPRWATRVAPTPRWVGLWSCKAASGWRRGPWIEDG